MGEPTADSTRPKPGPAPKREVPDCVIIRPLPKAVVLYPTAILCAIYGILGLFVELDAHWYGTIFMFVFGFNLFVMNFEFSRGTAFTLFALAVAGLFGGLFLGEKLQIPVFASMAEWVKHMDMTANGHFYAGIALILAVTFFFVWVKSRFDYWEVTSNELLHHHGLVGNVQRYPAPSLRITKEIHDVFEWLMLRSGRLILHPSGEARSTVLELVFNVNKKEALIKELLSKLNVNFDDASSVHDEH